MNGKTDRPRPFSVPSTTFDDNWSRTFGSTKTASSSATSPAPSAEAATTTPSTLTVTRTALDAAIAHREMAQVVARRVVHR